VLLGALDDDLKIFSQQGAIGQVRERVVKSRMPEVVFAVLKLDADPFLFGDVPVQFFDVSFGLLGAFAFRFGTRSFGFGAL